MQLVEMIICRLTVGENSQFKTIQEAINYINDQENKKGWTIDVKPGEYPRFVVLDGLDDLTVRAERGTVTIKTLCGDHNNLEGVTFSGGSPDTDGISLRNVQNVTLSGLTISVGNQCTPWYASGVSAYSESKEKANGFHIVECDFKGSGEKYGVFVCAGTSSFEVKDCTFDNVYEGIETMCDGTAVEDISITGNSFKNCSFAFHGYYGGENGRTMTFSDNTIVGNKDLRAKVIVQDQSDTGALQVDFKQNTLTCAIVGLVNLQGEVESSVLADNTFEDGSFYVEAKEPGSIDLYSVFRAPESSGIRARWKLNVDTIDKSKMSEAAYNQLVSMFDENGYVDGQNISITGIDSDDLIKTFTWFKDSVYIVTEDDELAVPAGAISITKNLKRENGQEGQESPEFAFTISLTKDNQPYTDDYPYLVEYYDAKTGDSIHVETGKQEPIGVTGGIPVSIENGVMKVSVKAGQSAVIRNLPAGVQYSVKEENAEQYQAIAKNENGVITKGKTANVIFNNYQKGTPEPDPSKWEVSKSKSATQLKDKRSNVTLSLPAREENLATDVVFVLDESSAYQAVVDQMKVVLESLKEQVLSTGANVKAGVVVFRGNAVTKPLAYLDSEEEIQEIMNFTNKKPDVGGSNMHAGLSAAKAMLDSDTSVEDYRKYMILIGDGITYTWGDEGTQYGVNFANADAPNTPMKAGPGPDAWNVKYGEGTVPENWDKHFESMNIGGTIAEKASVYDRDVSFDDKPFVTYEEKDQYASTTDIALYHSLQKYTELQQAGYRCYTIMASAPSSTFPGKTDGEVFPYGPSFMYYLSGGEEWSFADIQKNILYLLDAGSTVYDYIGYVPNDYNFDFVNSPESLKLKVGDTELPVTQLGERTYGFGNNGAEGYPYTLEYIPGTKMADEYFIWRIHVPVSQFKPVQLTYVVELTYHKDIEGVYEYGEYDEYGLNHKDGLYTNNSAVLYPVDSNGDLGDYEEFLKPTVSYVLNKPQINKPNEPNSPGGGGGDSHNPGGGSSGGPGVTIAEGPVPLAPGPVLIPDQEVPLAGLPKTGDSRADYNHTAALLGSMVAVAYILLSEKKRKKE